MLLSNYSFNHLNIRRMRIRLFTNMSCRPIRLQTRFVNRFETLSNLSNSGLQNNSSFFSKRLLSHKCNLGVNNDEEMLNLLTSSRKKFCISCFKQITYSIHKKNSDGDIQHFIDLVLRRARDDKQRVSKADLLVMLDVNHKYDFDFDLERKFYYF